MNQDKTIICIDCGQAFAFTLDEQRFYESKDLPDPQYCLICRGKYQAMKRDEGQYQGGKNLRRS